MPVQFGGTEELLTLAQIAERMPRRIGGRPCHPSTIYSWARQGIGGIKLETLRCGKTLVTTTSAVQEFFEKTSNPGSVPESAPAAPRTLTARRKAVAQAERDLAARGL